MAKRLFIIHGWDFNPKMNWYHWLKSEFEKSGFKVFVPEMPNTSEPNIDAWVSHLKKVVGKLDENTYFVGHSIGCQTIMRFLEEEKYDGKIGKVIFVAGWFKLDNLEDEEVKEIAEPWTDTPINFDKVKEKIRNLTVFLSSNEPYNYIEENKETFEKKLNAKVVILKNKGHFTEEDGVKELPEILKEIQDNASTNCVIIHGCPSNVEKAMDPETRTYDKHWIPWLKKELIKRKIETKTPLMPTPWDANYNSWKKEIGKLDINEESILIGHSCGGGFLVRWIDEYKKKVKKLILVSPGKAGKSRSKGTGNLYGGKTIINLNRYVKDEIIVFTSNDDISQHIKGAYEYEKELPATVIFLKDHGHFTQGDMETEEFPELLKEILKTILVDAVDAFVIESDGTFKIFREMHDLLETFPNRKIILTGANDEQFKKFGLDKMPYEVFTLKHNPEKTDPEYFEMMLKHFGLNRGDVIYFEHNPQAVKSAESIGIKSYYYDPDKKDLKALKEFLNENSS